MVHKFKNLMQRFTNDEEGIALTEYLILLGLLVGGVIVAVLAFGDALSVLWNSWTTWFGSGVISAPSV